MLHVDMFAFRIRIKEERRVGRSYINIVYTDLVELKMHVKVVTSLAFFLIWKLCVILISQKYMSLFIRHISSRACVDYSYFLIALYNKIFVLWYNALMHNFPFILLVSHSERWLSWFLHLADVVFITLPKSGYVRCWTIHRRHWQLI